MAPRRLTQKEKEFFEQSLHALDQRLQGLSLSFDGNTSMDNDTPLPSQSKRPHPTRLDFTLNALSSVPKKGESADFHKLLKNILQAYNHQNKDGYKERAQILLKACEYGRYLTVKDLIKTHHWDKETIQNAFVCAVQHENALTLETLLAEKQIQSFLQFDFIETVTPLFHKSGTAELQKILTQILETNPDYQKQQHQKQLISKLKEKWTVENDFEISSTVKYGVSDKRVAVSKNLHTGEISYKHTTSFTHTITSIFNFKANYINRITTTDNKTSTETQPFSHFDNDNEIREAYTAFKKLSKTVPDYRKKPIGPCLIIAPKNKYRTPS